MFSKNHIAQIRRRRHATVSGSELRHKTSTSVDRGLEANRQLVNRFPFAKRHGSSLDVRMSLPIHPTGSRVSRTVVRSDLPPSQQQQPSTSHDQWSVTISQPPPSNSMPVEWKRRLEPLLTYFARTRPPQLTKDPELGKSSSSQACLARLKARKAEVGPDQDELFQRLGLDLASWNIRDPREEEETLGDKVTEMPPINRSGDLSTSILHHVKPIQRQLGKRSKSPLASSTSKTRRDPLSPIAKKLKLYEWKTRHEQPAVKAIDHPNIAQYSRHEKLCEPTARRVQHPFDWRAKRVLANNQQHGDPLIQLLDKLKRKAAAQPVDHQAMTSRHSRQPRRQQSPSVAATSSRRHSLQHQQSSFNLVQSEDEDHQRWGQLMDRRRQSRSPSSSIFPQHSTVGHQFLTTHSSTSPDPELRPAESLTRMDHPMWDTPEELQASNYCNHLIKF